MILDITNDQIDIAKTVHGGEIIFIETAKGIRVSADDLLQPQVNDILRFQFGAIK